MPGNTLLAMIVGVTAFVLIAALWGMAMVLWTGRVRRRESELSQRLGLDDGSQRGDARTLRLWHDGREATTSVMVDASAGIFERFETACRDGGWTAPARSIAMSVAGAALGSAAVSLLLTGNAIMGLAVAVCVCVVFRLDLQRRIGRRRALMDSQLIDALELAARSLRVGHPLVAAFRLVSEEIGAPIGPLFGGIVQQQELGVPLDHAMRVAARESNSEEMKLFATSVVIQLRSGGNLADMMDRVAAVMRDRLRLARRVRVLIAQTQISKQILMALPVFVFVLLNVINPDYMRPLYTTTAGEIVLAVAAGALIIGAYIINRLATIRY